uniref:Uncharacterized protein n=1 Tax=Ixodes scapularis TaxID=6945 RepID=A0A4D5RWC1_IXOSC
MRRRRPPLSWACCCTGTGRSWRRNWPSGCRCPPGPWPRCCRPSTASSSATTRSCGPCRGDAQTPTARWWTAPLRTWKSRCAKPTWSCRRRTRTCTPWSRPCTRRTTCSPSSSRSTRTSRTRCRRRTTSCATGWRSWSTSWAGCRRGRKSWTCTCRSACSG